MRKLNFFRKWLAEALEFTLGNPSKNNHEPYAIGPQPYRDKPMKIQYF